MSQQIHRKSPCQPVEFVAALAQARRGRGLSQKALGARLGLPQSHISKIEAGKTDLRFSSLIEFARQLDLELVLVPRKYLPAIRSIIASPSDDSQYLYRLGRPNQDSDRPGGR
jgi:transcriptional regulator with XRE-family HTH domain